MFDVGFTEVILIGVVALIVVGPERLPAVAASVGRWVGKMQRFVRGVKSDFASEMESGDLKRLLGDQREQIEELREIVKSTQKDLTSTANEVVSGARKKMGELEKSTTETTKFSGSSVTAKAIASDKDTVIDSGEEKVPAVGEKTGNSGTASSSDSFGTDDQ
ncbi:MAG: Sec-independent protein translocase protein TatB [Granulosicoccus sp.]